MYRNFAIFLIFYASSGNLLAQDQDELDLLSEDSFVFEGQVEEAEDKSWWHDLRTTLQHTQSQKPGDVDLQRSSVTLQFERSLATNWYLNLDHKHSYFWKNDRLAEEQMEAYTHGKWQQAWLQYSRGACAVKLGKQTIIWGEVEGTFAADLVSPFDFTEQLLTDYGDIRRGQTLIATDCFFNTVQTQVFYNPEAKLDLFSHGQTPFTQSLGNEKGGKIKLNWEGGDISFMLARLHDNQPTAITLSALTDSADTSLPLSSPQFDFYGISSSLAKGRLLLKIDAGYRDLKLNNLIPVNTPNKDLAMGFEYTTANNHNINGGLWLREFYHKNQVTTEQHPRLGALPKTSRLEFITLGWSKTYWNDNLSISLLSNRSNEPRFFSTTVLAQYKADDFLTLSTALGFNESDNSQTVNPLFMQADKFVSLIAQYKF